MDKIGKLEKSLLIALLCGVGSTVRAVYTLTQSPVCVTACVTLVLNVFFCAYLCVWYFQLRRRSWIALRLTTFGFGILSVLGLVSVFNIACREPNPVFATGGSLLVGLLWYLGMKILWAQWSILRREFAEGRANGGRTGGSKGTG